MSFSRKTNELATPEWLLRNSAHVLLAGDMSALVLLFFCAVGTSTDAIKQVPFSKVLSRVRNA